MNPPSSVSTWLGRLRAGDSAAAALWRRYHSQLVELARGHPSRSVRRAADEEDVALSAFAAFCAGAAAGRFPDLTDRHDLWRLLFTLTLNAVAPDVLADDTVPEIALRQGCRLRGIERRWQQVRQPWQGREAELSQIAADGGVGPPVSFKECRKCHEPSASTT